MYKTLTEARAAKDALVERLQDIDLQLSERKATVSVGRVPNDVYSSYLSWRSRALRARAHIIDDMRKCKSYITANYQESTFKEDEVETIILLRDLYGSYLDKATGIGDTEDLILSKVHDLLEDYNVL